MGSRTDIVAVLNKKRYGEELTETEMNSFVQMAASGQGISDAQIGAMLMAIAIRGLTNSETSWLTKSMINSGFCFKWDDVICDKHSTGGVGDKVSIPLAPALASLGVKIPMLSGRGLGLTGGTLDKLESIPGFNVNLPVEKLKSIIDTCGVFIASPTVEICPADKKLYAIRDVTATVLSHELIVGSILSKKAAAGVKYLVLDIKVGKAALYKSVDEAAAFAQKMMENAESLGITLTCMLTKMDQPIGKYVGNSLEIEESLLVLQGKGTKDLNELVIAMGGQLLSMCGKAPNIENGISMMKEVLENGMALGKFCEMLVQQGVDPTTAKNMCYIDNGQVLPKAKETTEILTEESGIVTDICGLTLAKVVRDLGGGRFLPNDTLDLAAGVVVLVELGEAISKGQPWLRVHHNKILGNDSKTQLVNALTLSKEPPSAATSSRILRVIQPTERRSSK